MKGPEGVRPVDCTPLRMHSSRGGGTMLTFARLPSGAGRVCGEANE
jgi:hypothetical protein